MNTKNRFFSYLIQNIHILILAISSFASLSSFLVISNISSTKLNTFGPTAQIYFNGIKNGLCVSSVLLILSLIFSIFFINKLIEVKNFITDFYAKLSNGKKNLLILVVCILFSFISHAGNIVHGYFNMDDFEIIGLNHTLPFSQAVLTPHGNDHTIPLFMTEVKVLDTFFGQNPIPYNLFVFILFALIPFFTFLTFRKLGVGVKSFLVFLVIFSGASGWADMLTGFIVMSVYPQIILFFSVMSWSYITWLEARHKKYLFYFSLSTILALASDISGLWVLPGIFVFMLAVYFIKKDSSKGKENYLIGFIKENKAILFALVGIALSFGAFLYYTFVILQPNTFFTALSAEGAANSTTAVEKAENWRLLPIASNFFTFFTSGVSLSLFAPNIVKILTHPSINNLVKHFWPIMEIIILLGNIFLFWFFYKNSQSKERKTLLMLVSLIFITTAMVVIARPNHEIIPDFDYRYAGAPFYFYCIIIAFFASYLLQIKNGYGYKIVLPFIILIISSQQVFSFHSLRLKEESKLRSSAVIKLNNNLIATLDTLSKNKEITLPNLWGGNITETMPGITLSQYLIFFNNKSSIKLIQNDEMPQELRTKTVNSVASLRNATSDEFKMALMNSDVIRSYYAIPNNLSYKTLEISGLSPKNRLAQTGEITILNMSFDPEKNRTLNVTISTSNTSGNLEIPISFKNDFTEKKILGNLRIDDYTEFTAVNNRRIYNIEVNLLQIYTYALSKKVSNLSIMIPTTKDALLENLSFK